MLLSSAEGDPVERLEKLGAHATEKGLVWDNLFFSASSFFFLRSAFLHKLAAHRGNVNLEGARRSSCH